MTASMVDDIPGGEKWLKRRRARSLAIALGLGMLVLIFYAATIVRLGPNAFRKDGTASIGSKGKSIPITDPVVCKKAGTC
jgi:hypothetical protein